MRISHEAIYQALFIQERGGLKRELVACLRTGRALRVPRARTRGRGKKFVTPEILIRERPGEAADRAVPGHWEGDLSQWQEGGLHTCVHREGREGQPGSTAFRILHGSSSQAVGLAVLETIGDDPDSIPHEVADEAAHALLLEDRRTVPGLGHGRVIERRGHHQRSPRGRSR